MQIDKEILDKAKETAKKLKKIQKSIDDSYEKSEQFNKIQKSEDQLEDLKK